MLAQSDRFTITELCEQFGISRKTGHKHLERYATAGLKGLLVRSHRPHAFPQRTAESVAPFRRGQAETCNTQSLRLHPPLSLQVSA